LSVIESETFLVFQKMIEDFQANDEISIEKMQLMQDFFEKYHQQLAKHYGLEMLEEDKFRQVLQALRLNEGDAKIYRQKLETILPYLEKQTLDWQLTYRLHEAKLKYLENDATCVDDYWHLLPRMEDYNLFGEGEKYYWILSFIRSAVLQINIEEELVSKIGLMVEKAIHLKTQDYLKDYYNQRSPNFVLQDFDLLFGALIENIERIENRKIQQILLRLLWNAIVYQQKFINFFGAKTIVKVYDEQQFLELKQQLKACLVELHLFNKHQLKDTANEISRKINQLEHHWIKKTQKFCHQQNPENRSILFHFFTRQYGQKALLMLSFNQSYKWQVIRDFDKHEELLADFKQKKAASIKEIGWLALIQETVTFRNFGKPLAFFFNQYWEDRRLQKMAQLFGNHQETIEKAPRIDLYLDNLLFLFPFEQLPYQASEKLIGHQFSLNKVLLKNCKTKEVRPEKGIVIFAGIPPVGEILALEHTLTEGNLIQKIFAAEGYAARLFSGMAANITNLNQQMQTAQKPSIIHFGTHGIASADLAAETCALVLAPLPDRLSTALLTYEDIVRSNFRGADLVVLSACDSSIGKMQKSSPVQGLAYAFLSAGAEFVLASRIPTRDEQTQLFMRVFYDYLLKTDIANALRLTRIYFFEKTSIVTDEDITAWCLYS
jgi:hypothetical protein